MVTTSALARGEKPEPFSEYQIGTAYDEMFRANGRPRRHYRGLFSRLLSLPAHELRQFKQEADVSFFNQGITFTVYGRNEGTERIFPPICCRELFPARSGRPSSAG
jgi:uncharacterized circularly permuted ATP-grasp superfamily protein